MTHSVESGGTRVWNKDGEGMSLPNTVSPLRVRYNLRYVVAMQATPSHIDGHANVHHQLECCSRSAEYIPAMSSPT